MSEPALKKLRPPPPVDFQSTWKLRFQGAESRLWFGTYKGQPCVAKERFSKKYRHPMLDYKITKERTRKEVRALMKIIDKSERLGRLVPEIMWHSDSVIIMKQLTNYRTVNEYLNENIENVEKSLENFVQLLGECLAHLHNLGIIHGDLTTSNLLVPYNDNMKVPIDHIVPIDFGLSSFSTNAEDRAVDLYVLERALLTSHFSDSSIFERIFTCYMSNIDPKTCGPPPGPQRIDNKLQVVRQRGRKAADT